MWDTETGQDAAEGLAIDRRGSRASLTAGQPARQLHSTGAIARTLHDPLRPKTALNFRHNGLCCRIVLPAGAFSHRKENRI